MRTYDISIAISPDLPVWPGDPKIKLERVSKMETGDENNVTHLHMSAHAGTHVDAPFHFLGADAPTIDMVPLNLLTGRAYVLDVPKKINLINAKYLKSAQIPPRTRRLLFRTRNSSYWHKKDKEFHTDFVALSEDGAEYIVNKGVKLLGIDYLSVAPYHKGAPTHELLLSAGVVIVEGLNLFHVSQGRYTLYCLPLKILGADGAPARAILVGV